MTCEEARSLLSARMDGELDVPLRAAVDDLEVTQAQFVRDCLFHVTSPVCCSECTIASVRRHCPIRRPGAVT